MNAPVIGVEARRVCIGFGAFERKCENTAGCAHTPLWCERCNELRMAHISRRLAGIKALSDQIERQVSGDAPLPDDQKTLTTEIKS